MSIKNPIAYSSPIIIALDYADRHLALELVDQLNPADCRLKVGQEIFTLYGPDFVRCLQQRGFDIFLDLKFHDIPNTVGRAVAAAAELGVWMVNIHACGGERMMKAAKTALLPYGKQAPLLIAVTVLTSMDERDFQYLRNVTTLAEYTEYLAVLSQACGLDGVVCSAHEAQQLKTRCGNHFKLVTPGIRPSGSELGDQRRVMTPLDAQAAGVDYMVIGRPITQSAQPTKVLHEILSSLAARD